MPCHHFGFMHATSPQSYPPLAPAGGGGALIVNFWRHLQQPLIFKGVLYLKIKILGVLLVGKKSIELKILIPYW